jgi:hypothetical protein
VALCRSIQYPQGIISHIAIPEIAIGVTLGGGGAKRLDIQTAGSGPRANRTKESRSFAALRMTGPERRAQDDSARAKGSG